MLHTQVQKIVTPAVHPESAKQKVDVPAVTPPPAQDVPSTPPQLDAGGPQVEVSVRSANSTRNSGQNGASLKPKRHRRHKSKSKPKPKPESTDEGSYGGTQDQGTTTGGGGAADPPTGG